jgi:hypothetical protein
VAGYGLMGELMQNGAMVGAGRPSVKAHPDSLETVSSVS